MYLLTRVPSCAKRFSAIPLKKPPLQSRQTTTSNSKPGQRREDKDNRHVADVEGSSIPMQ